MNDNKSNTYSLNAILSHHDKIFKRDRQHERAFTDGPTTSFKMADGSYIEFRKMLTSTYWMKMFA